MKSGSQRSSEEEVRTTEDATVKPKVLRVALYFACATMAFGVASFFISAGRLWFFPSLLLLLSGFVLSGFGIRLTLINHRKKRKEADAWLVVLTIVGLVICCALGLGYMTERKPYFVIGLEHGPSRTAIGLTNEFIVFKGDEFQYRNVNGYLLIPASTPEIALSLANDSTVTGEAVTLLCAISTNIQFSAHGTWTSVERNEDKRMGTRSIAAELGDILPSVGKIVPSIRFSRWPSNDTPSLLSCWIRGKNVPDHGIALWLYVVTNLTRPVLTYSQAKDGARFKPNIPSDALATNRR